MCNGITSSIESAGECGYGQLLSYGKDGVITRLEMFAEIERQIKAMQPFRLVIAKMLNQQTLSSQLGYMKTEQVIEESLLWLSKQVVQVSKRECFNISQFESGTFAILISGRSPHGDIGIFRRALCQGFVSQDCLSGCNPITVSFIVGISRFTEENCCVNRIVRKAEKDIKCHEEAIWNGGRERNVDALSFSPSDLTKAIDEDQLELWYQPKVDMGTKDIIGVEALIRWQHPEHGLLLPASFLGWFNAFGLSGKLNHWIIFEGFRKCRELIDDGKSMTVALNIEASSFTDGVTMKAIELAQDRFNVPPGLIEFEIVETVVIYKGDKRFDAITTLKQNGYKIAIDDFGTGANNIAYLMYIPADTIKLDRMFCSTIDDERTLALTRAAIDMAKASNLTIVAEGIETEIQGNIMASLGCDMAQGYFYGKPSPVIYI